MAEISADIGVIGGSGIYSLLNGAEEHDIDTMYGRPSDKAAIGKIGNVAVAFIPRHGKGHKIPPHKVPYRANLAALKSLGVRRVIATGATGSLRKDYKPGDFVLFDQFVNMTHGRDDTIFDEDQVAHVSTAEPYCPEMRKLASSVADSLNLDCHKKGTVLVVNGPRFSTKAESRFFTANKMDVINMTQYPEAALAREMGMCYLGVGIVTDYDAGLEGEEGIEPVSFEEVTRKFAENVGTLKTLITKIVPSIPAKASCRCASSLDGAIIRV